MCLVCHLPPAIVIHMGVAFSTRRRGYARESSGSPPAQPFLAWMPLLLFITVMGLLTGIYTMLGGLLAVVWTESVQTVLLLIGAVVVTVVGYWRLAAGANSGTRSRQTPHPLATVSRQQRHLGTGNFSDMARHSRRSFRSGLVFHFARYPVLGIWYWCCYQTIVQTRAGREG